MCSALRCPSTTRIPLCDAAGTPTEVHEVDHDERTNPTHQTPEGHWYATLGQTNHQHDRYECANGHSLEAPHGFHIEDWN